jgi:hypothetical protein
MGNLPRSRPGRRSDKRAGASASPGGGAKSGTGARTTKAAASSARGGASAGTARRATGARKPAAAASARRAADGRGSGPDPLGDAVRVAAKVAGTGIGIATGILRRLPRP